MDLQMPVMGGVEATKYIRGTMKMTLPIVALSAAVLTEDKEESFAAGMNDFITKPIQITRLREVLDKYPCVHAADSSK